MEGADPRELVFFGAVPAFFARCTGDFWSSGTIEVADNSDSGTQYSSVDLPENSEVVVPRVPGRRLRVCAGLGGSGFPVLRKTAAESAQALEEIFGVHLGPGARGVASGIRSALLRIPNSISPKIENCWIRLKGCGNGDEGFPVRVDPISGVPSVRGACFEQNTLREALMTQKIRDLCSRQDEGRFQCANESIGWIQYGSLESPDAHIPLFCGVFKTIGDQRLGEHLLRGLETLIPLFFSSTDSRLAIRSFLQEIVPLERMNSDSGEIDVPSWLAMLSDIPLGTLKNFEELDSFSKIASILDPCDKVSPPLTLISSLKEHWDICAESLFETCTGQDLIGHFIRLYWRLGQESGSFLALIHRNGISWGTYADKLGTHCNAHVNNFVVCPTSDLQSRALLAPLDFDMAFDAHEFISNPDTFCGKFEECVRLERESFLMTLGGDDSASTGVISSCIDLDDFPELNGLRWALRDTMIDSFNKSYQQEIETPESSIDSLNPGKFSKGMQLIVELGLCVTADRIA